MPVNRPLAMTFAAIALLLAIVAALVVLDDAGPRAGPAAPATAPSKSGPRERTHARQEQRTRAEPATVAGVVDPPVVERLPWLPGSGFVVGTITDILDGEPVPNARVRLLHPTGEGIAEVRSDNAGRYQIEQVPETLPLVMQIVSDGHLTGLCCDVRLRDAELLRKDVALLRSARVSLTLTALPWQRRAEGVRVRVLDGLREVVRGVSDEDGLVALSVPELGRFELRIGGGEWAPVPAEPLALQPGSGDVELERSVVRGGGLVVDVRDADELPVPAVKVTVHGQGLEPIEGTTDADGLVELGRFPPDLALRVVALTSDGQLRGARPARVRDGYDEPVLVTLRATVRVHGVVRGANGRPIREAEIEVLLPEDGSLLGTVRTDGEGRFVVGDLPDTDVEISVRAPAFGHARVKAVAGVGGAIRITMSEEPSGVLEGRVLGPTRRGVPDAVVRVVPGDVGTVTETDGSFELTGVPVGSEQRVLVESPGLRVSERGRADRLRFRLSVDERHRVEIQMTPDEDDAGEDVEPEDAIRSVRGTIVRGTGAPVAAATVAWAGLSAVTTADGRFELRRPTRDHRGAVPMLIVTPPAGLLEPATLPLAGPDSDGVVALREIALRARPTCRLRLAETPGTHGDSLSFAVLLDTDDHLLGTDSEPFETRHVVTYDGTWLHVGAVEDWRRGGHRRAWVGVTTAHGPAAAAASWPAAAGPTQVVSPGWRDALTKVSVRIPAAYVGGRLRLRLTGPPDAAPIERLGLPDEITLRANTSPLRLDPLSNGTWVADLLSPEAAGLPTLRTTISGGRVRGFRPAR